MFEKIKISTHTSFQPLKAVLLGQGVSSSYFDWVNDDRIHSPLMKIVNVNNYNKEVFGFLKKHKIEPIICPIRHRYFWDGGLHCVTLDLQREGARENYF